MSVQHPGFIELERSVDSITIGNRHRHDLGDLDALAASIQRDGLLQPPTITPDGVLVCGARRIAAIRQLGWRSVNVWVRSGISDRLGHLLAEQDDNVLHKPLTPLEAAALYRELKALMAENAALRQAATRFSTTHQPGSDGAGKFPTPPDTPPESTSQPVTARAGEQAASMIPGAPSYKTLEKISYLEHLTTNPDTPEPIQAEARLALERIHDGAPVDPAYQHLKTLTSGDRDTRLHQLADDALARAKASNKGKKATHPRKPETAQEAVPERWPTRAFVLTWEELQGWWTHYDPTDLATELSDTQLEAFLAAVEGTVAFAEQLRTARTHAPAPTGRRLRAI